MTMVQNSSQASEYGRVPRTGILSSLVVWGAMAILAIWSLWAMRPLPPVPASASPQEFSAARAMVYVRTIAAAPHPTGSAAQDAVRHYLVEQLTALGVHPQVYTSVAANEYGTSILAGKTQDIFGVLRGTANSRAILLMAHYDSVRHAPGAADDGASVASILETLRALESSGPLKNDVMVLFTDCEEAGLLGAKAFVTGQAFVKDIGLVLNFEARGDRGTPLLFETSAGNSKLIEEVRRATPYMEGSSLFYSLYKTLPNDTDFTVFRPTGIPGLNFAFGNRLEAYHTRLDTIENLSQSSLQLHGTYALNLTRHFGQMDLAGLSKKSGDDIFFNLLGKSLIAYPQSWVIPGEIILTLLLAAAVFLALRKHQARGGKLPLSFLATVCIALAIPVILAALWWVLSSLLSLTLLIGDTLSNDLLLVGLLLVGAGVGDLLLRRFYRNLTGRELFLAALLFVWILSWVLILVLPAGSYVLQLPLAISLLCILAEQLSSNNTARWFAATAIPGMICTVFLLTPLLYLAYVFMSLGYVVIVAAGFLVGVLVCFSIPALTLPMPGGKTWFAPAAILVLLGICFLGIGAAESHYSPESPKPDNLIYSLDADRHSAAWISFDRRPDAWVSRTIPPNNRRHQPMPDYVAGSTAAVWTTPASPLNLPAPTISVTTSGSNDTRDVQVILQSRRDVALTYLTLTPKSTILSLGIDGTDVPVQPGAHASKGDWSISLYGWDEEPIRLKMKIGGIANPVLWVVDESNGLPPLPVERPSNLIAWYGSDVILVNRKASLSENTSAGQAQ